ncbi:adenosylhomocysteinase [Frondihabitans sp. VKM Ac-2883]|uniref:adenosylhomocysteinase n=1 Tax=Frondihabitans sp. VKM Ac-2883 TaxID=2783823 RepID=UPI00188AB39D|nr:adenosylhomocysteinase [Frondihabitans sp. VKM Ac-2883]MBF4576951.1 adenosylhomocysteinase [Frondihabitans sp. VKM Ac-2883]
MPEPDAAAPYDETDTRTDATRKTDTDFSSAAVRRFARATNQVIAGKTFRIRATAPALDRLLRDLGARPAAAGHDADLDWLAAIDHDAEPTIALPDRGDARGRIDWARRHMTVSGRLAAALTHDGILRGVRIGIAMVLEPKTAVLALLLRDAGAEVVVYAHADETDDEVADALRTQGLEVFADSRATLAEQRALAVQLLDRRPAILLDDGSHVIRLAHEIGHPALDTMVGAAEETTSGLRPLRILARRNELVIPVIAVNDARTKTYFDNRYGTGQSCVFAILDLLDTLPETPVRAGSRATVAGFGPVGEGVAQVLAALGLTVTVAETDPVRALQAVYAGYDVAELTVAASQSDLIVSATGIRETLSLEVLRAAREGAVVAVAGGVDQEVAIDAAAEAGATREPVVPKIERLTISGGPSLLLLDDGGCINITAAEGNPIEIMDLSFAVQLEAVRMLVDSGSTLEPGVHALGPKADRVIATEALAAQGIAAPGAVAEARAPRDGDPDGDSADPRTTRFGPLGPEARS